MSKVIGLRTAAIGVMTETGYKGLGFGSQPRYFYLNYGRDLCVSYFFGNVILMYFKLNKDYPSDFVVKFKLNLKIIIILNLFFCIYPRNRPMLCKTGVKAHKYGYNRQYLISSIKLY